MRPTSAAAPQAILGYGRHGMEADRLKPALLIIDMLVDFLDPWADADRAPLVAAIQSLAQAFRAARHPIIWVRQEFEPDLSDAFREMRRKTIRITIKGTPGCKIVPELTPHADDLHVIKKRYSAFFGTRLDQLILASAVDTVVLAGVNTHACVRTTAIDAYQRDRRVILAIDCIDSYDRQHHETSIQYMKAKIAEIMSNSDIRQILAAN